MNKKLVFYLVSFLWVAVIAGVVISKHEIIRTGQTVLLETVPVDPRDLLRGDYVILSYKISALDMSKIKSDKPYYKIGEVVFVKVEPKEKFWEAAAVGSKKGAYGDGVYLKGRVRNNYPANSIELDYGIESYFVSEGQGREIEKNMRGAKSSVEVQAVVSPCGEALIKNIYVNK
jgi:uncharacterized membrane-anchored protein